MTEVSRMGAPVDDGAFVRATSVEVGVCPARADFVELRFTTEVGSWNWCFPDPGACEARPADADADADADGDGDGDADGALALIFGRYGVQAHEVANGVIGPALPSSEALPRILGGCRPLVSRDLVAWGA
jgi:hypothetical protein